MRKQIDITGQQFGRLRVIRPAEFGDTNEYWLCMCECGNEVVRTKSALLKGTTESCGCLRKERQREKQCTTPYDITGMRFGHLTAMKDHYTSSWYTYWRFRCDCGTEFYAIRNNVVRGNTKSCGCSKRKKRA